MAIDPAHPVPPNLPRSAGITTGKDFLAAPHDFMAKMHQNYPPIFYDVNEWLKRIPDFSGKARAQIVYRPGGVVGPEYVPLVWKSRHFWETPSGTQSDQQHYLSALLTQCT
jgi:hypothetical protein